MQWIKPVKRKKCHHYVFLFVITVNTDREEHDGGEFITKVLWEVDDLEEKDFPKIANCPGPWPVTNDMAFPMELLAYVVKKIIWHISNAVF